MIIDIVVHRVVLLYLTDIGGTRGRETASAPEALRKCHHICPIIVKKESRSHQFRSDSHSEEPRVFFMLNTGPVRRYQQSCKGEVVHLCSFCWVDIFLQPCPALHISPPVSCYCVSSGFDARLE